MCLVVLLDVLQLVQEQEREEKQLREDKEKALRELKKKLQDQQVGSLVFQTTGLITLLYNWPSWLKHLGDGGVPSSFFYLEGGVRVEREAGRGVGGGEEGSEGCLRARDGTAAGRCCH